jgi:transposase-like protein
MARRAAIRLSVVVHGLGGFKRASQQVTPVKVVGILAIADKKYFLWRAVGRDGFALDVLVQSRRDAKAAKRFLRKLLKKQGWALRVMVTDKLRSYAAAKRTIMPGVEHRQHKGINDRAENSHQPTQRRERQMKRFPEKNPDEITCEAAMQSWLSYLNLVKFPVFSLWNRNRPAV